MIATTHPTMSVSEPMLFVAFELGKQRVEAGDDVGVRGGAVAADGGGVVIGRRWSRGARRRACSASGWREAAVVVSCYEAGRDGFWIHRALTQRGAPESGGRFRRASKSVAGGGGRRRIASMRASWCRCWSAPAMARRKVWSEVRVPSEAAEAARQVSRERTALTHEQTRLINQMRGWLATWGTALPRHRRHGWWANGARLGRGRAARARCRRALARAEASARAGGRPDRGARRSARKRWSQRRRPKARCSASCSLKGVATTSASVLLDEGLVWRGVPATGDRSAGFWGSRPSRTTVATRRAIKESVGRATVGCRSPRFSSRGAGCSGNRTAR